MQWKLAEPVVRAIGSLAAWVGALAAAQYMLVVSGFDAGINGSIIVAIIMPICSVIWSRAFLSNWIALASSLLIVVLLGRIHFMIFSHNIERVASDEAMMNIGLTRGFYDFLFTYISPLILILIWACIVLFDLFRRGAK